MRLNAGEDIEWPVYPFITDSSNFLAVINRVSILRLPADIPLPGLSPETTTTLQLKLRVTQLNDQISETKLDTHEGCEWILNAVQELLDNPAPGDQEITVEEVIKLLHLLHEDLENKENRSLAKYTPLSNQSATNLFHFLERNEKGVISSSVVNQQNDALLACVGAIHEGEEKEVIDVSTTKSNTRMRLQLLLDHNNLIGRDVIVSGEDLKNDCGELIAFFEDNPSDSVLLKSSKNQYTLWAPNHMTTFKPLSQCMPILKQLSPRMVAVSPTLSDTNPGAIGLLRFAFGTPKDIGKLIVSGLILGFSIGFLLSIGREVGAARWVFSLATIGTVLGAFLGILSGGFRSGVAIMFLATCLSMLTPTFNVVITNQALPDRDFGLLLQISMLLFTAGVVRVAFEWIQSRDLLLTQHSGAAKTQMAGMNRLLRLPTEFFRQRSIGQLQLGFGALEELRKEIQVLMEGGLVKLILTTGLYTLFMLRISVKLTLLAIVVAALIMVPTMIMALQSRPLQRHQEIAEAAAQSRNLELISSVSKLRMAGAEASAAHWWATRFQQVVNLEDALDAKQANTKLLQAIMPNIGTLLVYIVITRLISEAASSPIFNAPNVGQQLGFFAAFGTFVGGVASLAGLLSEAFDLPIIYERARPILDAKTEVQNTQEDAGELQGNIQFDRVCYRYDLERPLVLDSVSFEAKAGDYIAVVGPSGSGKSTLVRLLLGFATPENGTVRFDGRPLEGMELRSVRRQIGTVLQTNTLFSGSLIEAIAGGAVVEESEAWHAAELAGLADDIREMPMGLQTIIPDGGGTLSGGQRQRVAIARALVRKPRILIFDEATSALDNRTQAIVSRSLDQLSITRIVIAHRLSTIKNADKIITLDHGQLQEEGDYEDLMSNKGLFFQLMERQIS